MNALALINGRPCASICCNKNTDSRYLQNMTHLLSHRASNKIEMLNTLDILINCVKNDVYPIMIRQAFFQNFKFRMTISRLVKSFFPKFCEVPAAIAANKFGPVESLVILLQIVQCYKF